MRRINNMRRKKPIVEVTVSNATNGVSVTLPPSEVKIEGNILTLRKRPVDYVGGDAHHDVFQITAAY